MVEVPYVTDHQVGRQRRRDRVRAIVVVLVLLLAAWLDRDGCIQANRADIFTAIWAGIQVVASWLGAAGAAIATSLEAVVSYLVSAVAWLGKRVADILLSTGGMFARVWDGLKIVWNSVLKPFLVWADQQLTRLQTWLKDTFGPVFKFLRRVRDELDAIYARFVRPVVDTIEFLRQLNRTLLLFHIDVLKSLDATLAKIEQRIEEPFLWLRAKIVELQNAVTFIVTADGFFQRLTLLRSMNRYAPEWVQMWWKTSTANINTTQSAELAATEYPAVDLRQLSDDVAAAFRGDGGTMDRYTTELADDYRRSALLG